MSTGRETCLQQNQLTWSWKLTGKLCQWYKRISYWYNKHFI